MKLSTLTTALITGSLAATCLAGPADYPMPAYAGHGMYPAALMSQGFFVNINGIYSRDVLVKGTVLNNAAKTPVTFNEPWGFSGNLGYQTHLGANGTLIAGLQAGYSYLGKLAFAGSSGSTTVPKAFKLQMATALLDAGMQVGQLSFIAKGGVAVQLAGHDQTTADYTTTVYRFGVRVVPMVGGEIGFTFMPNLKLSAEVNYVFGHKLDATNMGTRSYQAASGGYRALSGMVGLTYYMN